MLIAGSLPTSWTHLHRVTEKVKGRVDGYANAENNLAVTANHSCHVVDKLSSGMLQSVCMCTVFRYIRGTET